MLAVPYMPSQQASAEAMAIANWLAAAERARGGLTAGQKADKARLEARKAEHHGFFW